MPPHSASDRSLTGENVRRAAALFGDLLASSSRQDWSACAGDLTWTAAEVVAHVADVCGFYAIHLAVRSHCRLRFDVTLHPTASVADWSATVEALAAHLAGVIDSAPAETRAWHHWGMADPVGFAAMACDELLIHGRDIADGWAQPFEPDRELCARILTRLFPWAPPIADPWDGLRWANGRVALPDHPRLLSDWAWHSAPLDEWDGRRRTATQSPDCYTWDPSTQRWQPLAPLALTRCRSLGEHRRTFPTRAGYAGPLDFLDWTRREGTPPTLIHRFPSIARAMLWQ